MKTENTFTATIYVGFKDMDTHIIYTLDEARRLIQQYVDDVSLCVTLTPTEFIYKYGNEPGAAIGLINYPRFPTAPEELERKALELAEILRGAFNQYKVSVVFPHKTVMLEKVEN